MRQLLVPLVLHASVGVASGQTLNEVFRILIPEEPNPQDRFGQWLAMDDGKLVITSQFGDALATSAGTAALFDPLDGSLTATFDPGQGTVGSSDRFGNRCDISHNIVAVSAPRDDGPDDMGDAEGAVYVFDVSDESSPVLLRTLRAPVDPGANFGVDVAVGDGVIAAGAFFQDRTFDGVPVPTAGVVFLYDLATGSLLSELTASAPLDNVLYGFSIDIDGDVMVVGGRSNDAANPPPATNGPGVVDLYDISDPSNPVLLSSLQPSDNLDADGFGDSVAIDGDRIVVGARFSDQVERNAGSVYVFDISDPAAPVETHRILPPALSRGGAAFGTRVAMRGEYVVVGAPEQQPAGFNGAVGAAYVYDRDTGDLIVRLLPEDYDDEINVSNFGVNVAVDGSRVAVADRDGSNSSEGTVYVFNLCAADVNMDGMLDGSDFNAWLAAFSNGDSAADQNNDGMLDGSDFNAWLANFQAGCS